MAISRVGSDKQLIRRPASGVAKLTPVVGSITVPLTTDEAVAALAADSGSDFAGELAGVIDARVPAASTTVQGKVELATNAEATTGTDTVRAVTPAGMKAAINALIAGAPGALDTLNEIATQLASDESAAATLTTLVTNVRNLSDSTIATNLAASYVRQVKTDLTVTVGSGGDYSTISAALADLTSRRAVFQSRGHAVEVRLLSGFVMAEQVSVVGMNLGWIVITSDDATVTISRAALTQNSVIDHVARQPAFEVCRGGTLPIIDVLFNMDTSGTAAAQCGFVVGEGSSAIWLPGSGCTNATWRGLSADRGARCTGYAANFSGAGNVGIRLNNASGNFPYLTATGCGGAAVACAAGAAASLVFSTLTGNAVGIEVNDATCNVDANSADVSHSTTHGIHAAGGNVDFRGGIATDCGGTGIYALNGAYVDATPNGVDRATDVSRCNRGLDAQRGARIIANNVVGTACTAYGAAASSSSFIEAISGVLTGAATSGIIATTGSHINATSANVQKGGSPSSSDCACATGATVIAHGMTGGLSKPANVVTTDGLIIQTRADGAGGTASVIGSKTYDPPSIAAGATVTTTVTATGALTPDTVLVSHLAANNGGLRLRAWVSSADTVSVEFYNPTASAVDVASGTLRVRVFKEF